MYVDDFHIPPINCHYEQFILSTGPLSCIFFTSSDLRTSRITHLIFAELVISFLSAHPCPHPLGPLHLIKAFYRSTKHTPRSIDFGKFSIVLAIKFSKPLIFYSKLFEVLKFCLNIEIILLFSAKFLQKNAQI